MKILLVSSGSGSRGGGEIFLEYLGLGLRERGHEVFMWIPEHSRMDELANRCSAFARVMRSPYRSTYDHPLRSLGTSVNWEVSRRVANEWLSVRPDVVHVNKQNLEDGLDLLRAARMCGLPTVCTIHLTQTARYLRAKAAWLRDLVARRELRLYQGVMVAVQRQREDMLRRFLGDRARTETIFNGVPPAKGAASSDVRKATRKELGVADTEILIMGLGRLVKQKRPLQFLGIARELHARIPHTRFLWVGDGDLAPQWRETIEREKLGAFVASAGWQADALPYLLASDLLLHVAEFEGLPFAVLEAMAAGLPCALTRELMQEIPLFDKSVVLGADDLDDLTDKLKDPVALRNLSERSRHLVATELSLAKMTESYERLYVHEARSAGRRIA